MENKNFKNAHVIVALLIALGGIILIMVPNTNINNIGSVMLISGIYTIFDSFMLKNSLIELVIQKVKLDKEIDAYGVIELGSTLTNIDYKDLIEKAETNIDIILL